MSEVLDSAPARGPGAILAAERERQGLSRADVAQRLHMSVHQVEALEASDYARLPSGMFLRGFVRNYAKALGLDGAEMLRSLALDTPREPAPRIVVPSQNIRFDPLRDRFASPYVKAAGIATALLLLGFAAMYWWLFVRAASPAASARKPAAEVARREAPPAPALPAPAPIPATEAKPAQAAPLVELPRPEPAQVVTTVDASQVLAAGGGVIRFKFKGNSWVEIKDGRGRVLLSRINPGGSEAEVIGSPPFSVIVGNAPQVRMYYNNREFDLEPHTRVAVARFIVE